MEENEVESLRHWTRLGKTLAERSSSPLRHPTFVLYFVVAVILVGGAGPWLELYKLCFIPDGSPLSLEPLRTAIITFFTALAGSSCMQLILEENEDRALRAMAICALTVLSVLALIIAPAAVNDCFAVALGLMGCALALWTWWISNAKQPGLQDERSDAAVGKRDPKAGLAGSLDGFTA